MLFWSFKADVLLITGDPAGVGGCEALGRQTEPEPGRAERQEGGVKARSDSSGPGREGLCTGQQ